jgi:hypothetical protein
LEENNTDGRSRKELFLEEDYRTLMEKVKRKKKFKKIIEH